MEILVTLICLILLQKNSKLNRLFNARKYSYEFYNSIKLMKDNFDVIRYGADWVKKVLLINNFEEDKLAFIRPCISEKIL